MEIKIYPLAFDRADARVNIKDISAAIEKFNGANKKSPTTLYLNPIITRQLEGALPDLEIIEHGGMLTWELGLSVDGLPDTAVVCYTPKNAPGPNNTASIAELTQSPIPTPVTELPSPINIIKPPYHKNNQLTIFDTVIDQVISEAFSNSKTPRERSSRAISRLLKSRGIEVSHMTISRRIKSLKCA